MHLGCNVMDTMCWLLVFLTTVFCAPLVDDPFTSGISENTNSFRSPFETKSYTKITETPRNHPGALQNAGSYTSNVDSFQDDPLSRIILQYLMQSKFQQENEQFIEHKLATEKIEFEELLDLFRDYAAKRQDRHASGVLLDYFTDMSESEDTDNEDSGEHTDTDINSGDISHGITGEMNNANIGVTSKGGGPQVSESGNSSGSSKESGVETERGSFGITGKESDNDMDNGNVGSTRKESVVDNNNAVIGDTGEDGDVIGPAGNNNFVVFGNSRKDGDVLRTSRNNIIGVFDDSNEDSREDSIDIGETDEQMHYELLHLLYHYIHDSIVAESGDVKRHLLDAIETIIEQSDNAEAIGIIEELIDHERTRRVANAKEAPLVNVDVQLQSTTSTSGYDDLKAMYIKRGALCTRIQGYGRTPIYVIGMCPLGTAYSVTRTKCEYTPLYPSKRHAENIIDLTVTPVQDSEGFVYKNMYCAQCNGVTSMQAWQTKLDCDDLQSVSLSDGLTEITLMDQFSNQIMGCTRRLAPSMPTLIHQCAHVDPLSNLNQWYHQTRISDLSKGDTSPFPLSFSILMNFGFDGKTHILFTTTATPQPTMICNQNEKYDPVNNKCRPIVCYSGYQLVDRTCQKIVNYDVEANADDLASYNDVEDPLQITLTMKDITYGDVYLLECAGAKEKLVASLANLFNISGDRIQNLTVRLVNTTDLANSTQDRFIEIHRFTTPNPLEHLVKVDGKHHPSQLKGPIYVEPTVQTLKRTRQTGSKKRANVRPYIGYERKGQRAEYTDDTKNGAKNVNGDREWKRDTLLDVVKSETRNTSKFIKQSYMPATIKEVQTDPVKEHEETGVRVDPSLGHVNVSRLSSADIWTVPIGISVRINFILQPAHRNKTLSEKSVKTVVQSMSDLINSNAFSLTVNGTAFKVQGLENTPPPASMELFCTRGVSPFLVETDFELLTVLDPNRGANVTVISVNRTGKVYYPGEYDLTFNIDGNTGDLNQTHVSSFAFVCDMPKIADKECDRIVLSENEFKLLMNKSIKFASHVYNMSEYEYNDMDNSTAIICTPDWITSQSSYNYGNQWTMACGEDLVKLVIAESYLTFILGVISLICMLSVLITYSLFEKLRNLPGVNTMNLTLSLFLGELLFIVSGWIQPHQEWLCSAFGMVLHYLFLASFFWMNVMSFDVFKTFAKKCILRRIRTKAKYGPRYALYAWGGPLVIVSVCAVIDFGELVDGVSIGYGGRSASASGLEDDNATLSDGHVYSIGCWIQEPVASMAAFGGPMILILLSNSIMFARTIICIRASSRSTKSSVRKNLNHLAGKDDVMLYIRMSTVMGFTWIFGLASSVVSAFAGPPSRTTCIILHLLGILFIVFNCSQGIFIFFAFVFNRRVLALYRARVQQVKRKKERHSSSMSCSRSTLDTNISETSLSHIT